MSRQAQTSRPQLPPGPYLVVGLARSGQAAALALRERGAHVIGFDAAHPAGAERLADLGVELHLGGEGEGVPFLHRARTIVKSPGVPTGVPVVQQGRARGVCVIGELELAWRLLPNEFVAVTGTNGKTTTVELIGHIHRVAGKPVAVAGNVGSALSGLVGSLAAEATVICEASSFQLEDAIAFAPELAVLLNVAPDHLDRHGTMAAYTQAKLRIFANQRPRDTAVLPLGLNIRPGGDTLGPDVRPIPGDARRVLFGEGEEADLSLADGVMRWRGEPLIEARELALPGRHNLQNAMAAAAACLVRGLDVDAVRSGLRSFPGVAHRLELVAERGGVRFVNDSKATNVASTLVALEALAPEAALPAEDASRLEARARGDASIHLIVGGQAKAQDFAPLRPAVASTCRAVYLIGEDAQTIAAALRQARVPLRMSETLERAVEQARAAARPGETVLLSPACASFDQFADFEARGERFGDVVAKPPAHA